MPDLAAASAVYRDTLGAIDGGELAARRAEQARSWLWDEVSANLTDELKADADVRKRLPEVEQRVIEGALTPAAAARSLVETFVERERAADSSSSPGSRRRARQ